MKGGMRRGLVVMVVMSMVRAEALRVATGMGRAQRVARPLMVTGGEVVVSNAVIPVPPMVWDTSFTIIAGASAFYVVKFFSWLASEGVLPSKVTRKLIHVACGPLFLASWPFFSQAPTAKYFASCVRLRLCDCQCLRSGNRFQGWLVY